jgi:acetyl-CoA carboxylase carboxyltransferase component
VKGRRNQNRAPNNNHHGYVRQKTQGKLWVRERINALVDKQSFREIGSIAGNGKYDDKGNTLDYTPANFISGTAKVNQRDVVVAADDFSIRAGHADGAIWGKSVSAFVIKYIATLQTLIIVEALYRTVGAKLENPAGRYLYS